MVARDGCINTRPSETGRFVRTMWLLGSDVASFAYAILLILAFNCVKTLRQRKRGSPRLNRCLIGYAIFAAVVGTAALVLEIRGTLHGVLDDVCIGAHLQPPDPYEIRAVIIYALINSMTDGLLVWRCYAVSRGLERGRWSVLLWLIPLFVYTALLGADIAIVIISTPHQRNGKHLKILFSLLFGISALLNTLITLSIVTLLFRYRRMMIRAFGREHKLPFLRIIPVLIESAALIVIVNIFVIVAATSLGSVSYVATQLWMHVQPIASLLIIDRVSRDSDYFSQNNWESQTLDRSGDFEPPLSSFVPSDVLVIGKEGPIISNS